MIKYTYTFWKYLTILFFAIHSSSIKHTNYRIKRKDERLK